MSITLWLAFVGTVVPIVLSPGPSVLLVSSHRIEFGPNATLPTILGDLSANILQMIVASVGLVTIVTTSAVWFGILKWVGVGYLVLLGVRRLWRPRRDGILPVSDPATGTAPTKRLFFRGFAVSAANPKAVLFFGSLFPLFLEPRSPLVPQLFLLGSTFVVLDGSALHLYAELGGRVRSWLSRQHREHWEDRFTGACLIGAAVALASKRVR